MHGLIVHLANSRVKSVKNHCTRKYWHLQVFESKQILVSSCETFGILEEWIISSISSLGATRSSPRKKLNDIIARNGHVYLSLSRLLHVFHVRLEALQRTEFTISGYQACHGWVEAQRFGSPAVSTIRRHVERKRLSLTYLHNTLSLSVLSCSCHVVLPHCIQMEAVPVHMNPDDGDKAGRRNVGLRRRYDAVDSPRTLYGSLPALYAY